MNTINQTNRTINKTIYLSNGSIVFSAILASAIFMLQIMNMPSIVSLCFYISIALVGVNYFLRITSTKKMSAYILIIAVLMLLSFAISGFIGRFEVYKRAIIVLCCVICIDNSYESKLKVKEFRIIEYVFIIAVYFSIYKFYIGGLRNVLFKATNSVAMNFSNPNALALWLTAFFIAVFICFFVEKRRFFKLLLFVADVLLLPMISATESRNSFVSCVLVIAAFVFINLHSKKIRTKKLPKWFILLFTILPFIIFAAYMYIVVPNIEFFEKTFSFLIGFGKSLRSRAVVWGIVDQNLLSCFFFGKYNAFHNSQMHNSLMTLYCMFGAPVTYLISTVFYDSVKKKNIYSQIALIGIWSTGCFEASVFVGVAGIYLMLQILPAIGNIVQNTNKEQEQND